MDANKGKGDVNDVFSPPSIKLFADTRLRNTVMKECSFISRKGFILGLSGGGKGENALCFQGILAMFRSSELCLAWHVYHCLAMLKSELSCGVCVFSTIHQSAT